jgi:hypothetical protein
MADWLTCRRRIADNIEELRQWLQDGITDNDDVRTVVNLLSTQQQRLRLIDVLLVRDPRLALAYQAAWERGEVLLNWGWVWTA